MVNTTRRHIVGMDAWRGLALSTFGVLIHVLGLVDAPWSKAIRLLSQSFRMEVFFVIAGFLSVIVSPNRIFRSIQLGIPFMFAYCLILPLNNMMIGEALWTADIGHLWFIVILSFCSLINVRSIDTVDTIFLVFVIKLSGSVLMALITSHHASWGLLSRLFYFPIFFGFGRHLAETGFSRPVNKPIAICAASIIVAYSIFESYSGIKLGGMYNNIILSFIAILSVLISREIVAHAVSIVRLPVWLLKLTKSSYTVYLIHFGLVRALFHFVGYFIVGSAWPVIITSLLIISICVTIHFTMVTRYSFFGLLVNGKLPPKLRNHLTRTIINLRILKRF